MRYLYSADGEELIAYAPGRRDFFSVSDDSLWAHESHEWLVAAKSGALLAHRTGSAYYGVTNGECLYRVTTVRRPEAARSSGAGVEGRLRISSIQP